MCWHGGTSRSDYSRNVRRLFECHNTHTQTFGLRAVFSMNLPLSSCAAAGDDAFVVLWETKEVLRSEAPVVIG